MVKRILIGVLTFIAGGITGGAIVGTVVTQGLRDRLEVAENENLRLRAVNETLEKPGVTFVGDDDDDDAEEEDEKRGEFIRRRYSSAAVEPDYDPDDPDNEDWFEDSAADRIRVISEQSYHENYNYNVSHERLVYYQRSDTLVDERNNVIKQEENTIGSEACDLLQDTRNEVIYVADELAKADFEIIVDRENDYFTDILGLDAKDDDNHSETYMRDAARG